MDRAARANSRRVRARSREFKLHPLAIEDAVHAHQRPKVERYGDSWFVVLKTAQYIDSEEVVRLGELMVFVGAGFVVTVRHGDGRELASIRAELESQPEVMRKGPFVVLHAIWTGSSTTMRR